MKNPGRLLPLALSLSTGCTAVAHVLDDLEVVHQDASERLAHRFQVERFGWFGGWLRFGPIGDLLGPWRYGKRVKDDLPDPFGFCAERIVEVGEKATAEGREGAEAVYLAAKVLLADPYVLSRIFAAEALARVAGDAVGGDSLTRAMEKGPEDYRERAGVRAEQLAALHRLKAEGKANPSDLESYRKAVAELASFRYERPQEALEVLRLFGRIAASETGAERKAVVEAARHLIGRTVSQALLEGLRDANEFVREAALVSLFEIQGKSCLEPSLRILAAETSPIVRRRLAQLCGDLSLEEARRTSERSPLDFLLGAARDADGSVAVNAMASLSRITGSPPNFDREYWRAWWEEDLLRGGKRP